MFVEDWSPFMALYSGNCSKSGLYMAFRMDATSLWTDVAGIPKMVRVCRAISMEASKSGSTIWRTPWSLRMETSSASAAHARICTSLFRLRMLRIASTVPMLSEVVSTASFAAPVSAACRTTSWLGSPRSMGSPCSFPLRKSEWLGSMMT